MGAMATTAPSTQAPRLGAVLREEERVTPLELFFDLVFVLAITQCTALMAAHPTWTGVAQAMLVLGVLWWSWAVRAAHIALFLLAARDDPALRKSIVAGIGGSSALAVGLLLAAAAADGGLQLAIWAIALLLDFGGPYLFGSEGWKLAPGHFAERHGLIFLIALGESIVAIGVGAKGDVDAGVVVAATLGMAVAAAMWWLYFDVVALVAERRLATAAVGREQNEMARDSYSYLHFPMVAGVILLALGLKKTLGAVEDPLKLVPAAAILGGPAIYLLAHVAFRLRNVHTLNKQRLVSAVALVAFIPAAVELPSLATLAILAGLLTALIAYEAVRFAEARDRVRHQLVREATTD